jgi:hypothetical protein
MTALFHIAGIGIPHSAAVQAEDGLTLFEFGHEHLTAFPVTRWRVQHIVPAPGAVRRLRGAE